MHIIEQHILASFKYLESNFADDDMTEEDDEIELIDRKRVKGGSVSNHGKLGKDEPGAKLKKRPRVLVEVSICFKLCQYDTLCDISSLEYMILIICFCLRIFFSKRTVCPVGE